MVKTNYNINEKSDSVSEAMPLEYFIGPDFPKFKAALIVEEVSRLLKRRIISSNQVDPLKEDIKNDTYYVEEDRENGSEVSKSHPRCKFAKMTFESLSQIPLVCFVKRRSSENSRHVVELHIPDKVRKSLDSIVTPKCIFNNDRVMAYELFDPEEISIAKYLHELPSREGAKEDLLENLVNTVTDIHSINLGHEDMEILSKNDYVTDYAKWKIPEIAGDEYIQKVVEPLYQYSETLKSNGKGLIHNDLHLRNMHRKGKDRISIIDWEWAMVGAPQTDITRVAMGLGLDASNKSDDEKKFVMKFYDSLIAKGVPVSSKEEFSHIYSLAKSYQYGLYANLERRHVEKNNQILQTNPLGINRQIAEAAVTKGENNIKLFTYLSLKTYKEAYKQHGR